MRNKIFISYNRDDREWLDRLKDYLLPRADDEGIPVWDDSNLAEKAGEHYDDEIRTAIATARVAVLLVTSDYLASDYIRRNELRPILKAAEKKELTILWVSIRETDLSGSGLEPIQALNELANPLANLTAEDQNDELREISEHIVQSALSRKVEKGHYLRPILGSIGLLTLLVMLTVLLKNLLAVWDGVGPVLVSMKPIPITGTHLILALCLLALTTVALYAYRTFRQHEPPPFPSFLWRFVYNELPITVPETIKPRAKFRVLLVHDASTEKVAESVRKNYKGEKLLSIRLSKVTPAFKAHTLKGNLVNSDALYLFWTGDIRKTRQFKKTVLRWANKESHKPVLVVKFLPQSECDLNLKMISRREAVPGLWQLLARSTERAYLWREQARRYWIASFVVSAGLLLTGILLIPALNGVAQLEKRDYIDTSKLDTLSLDLQSTNRALEAVFEQRPDQTKEDVRLSLNKFAFYAVNDMMSRQIRGSKSGVDQLTFWRMTRRENEWRIYEVAWSHTRLGYFFPVDTIKPDTASIIESAFKHQAFVLWKVDARDGEEAAWSLDGKVLGHRRSNSITFDDDQSKGVFKSLPINQLGDLTALMCVAAPLGNEKTINGICLETTMESTALNTRWTRHYLLRAMSIMAVWPENLLITDWVVKNSRKADP